MFAAHGAILHGWALAEEGDGTAEMVSMRQGLAVHASTGVLLSRPYWLSVLSAGLRTQRRRRGGLRLVDEALTMLRDQHLWDAELHRLKGELLLLTPAPTAQKPSICSRSEFCFRRAPRNRSTSAIEVLGTSR